ncbi:MAG TPA: hypothetical protein VN513_08720, partial [Gemmatimonadales bacterium]|nr:hypothetical protein [Gemmatimonadales bacterium]
MESIERSPQRPSLKRSHPVGLRLPALLLVLALAGHLLSGAPALAAVPSIAAGHDRSCALSAGGSALCWGNDATGALGDGAAILSRTPLQVTGLSSGVLSVGTTSAAYHTCAVTIGGAAFCWGNNSAGQLGNGSYAAATVPVPVTGLSSGIAAIVPGNLHTCALTTAGAIYCWGYNQYGQLGDGTT